MNIKHLGMQVLLIRGSLFLLQIITSFFISPYDTSAFEAYSSSSLASLGYANWDAVYFNHLAKEGYNYECFGAFFPLYPSILAAFTSILYLFLQTFMSYDTCLILTALLLNNTLFYFNAFLVQKLAKLYGLNDVQAYQAALLYSINPASVFMSVGYTESMFSCLVLLGLIIRESDSQWYFILFCLATGVRSNGLSLILFILYDHILCMIKAGQLLVVNLIVMVVQLATCIAPFLMFQNHLHHLYCSDPNDASPWCEVGISYGYIQAKYWGVGMFKYWTLQQVPNFLLAAPMFTLVGIILFSWAEGQYNRALEMQQHSRYQLIHIFSFNLAGFLHLGALTVIALFSMHVQVVTRFIVANCPFLFLYCATIKRPVVSRAVVCYFVVYSVVGTVVHSTFYPWT